MYTREEIEKWTLEDFLAHRHEVEAKPSVEFFIIAFGLLAASAGLLGGVIWKVLA